MTRAWDLPISSTDKLVLLALADWSNDDGVCWPSMSKLERKTGLTDRSIRTCIGRLRDAGYLGRDEKPGKGVIYTVLPGNCLPPEGDSPRKENAKTPERASANTLGSTIPKKTSSPLGKRTKARKPEMTLIPDGFTPSMKPGSITAATVDGWPPGRLADELEHFADHHTVKATLSADWQASWRTWVKTSKKWEPRHGKIQQHGRPSSRPTNGFGLALETIASDCSPDFFGRA